MTDALLDVRSPPATPSGDSSFPIELLARPARIDVGGKPLGRNAWLALHDLATRAGAALSTVVGLPTRLEVFGAGAEADLDEAAFGLALAVGEDGPAFVTIDPVLARLVVDAIETAEGVRGAGALTAAELGILEFAVLAGLDDLSRTAAALGRAGVLESFPPRSELRARVAAADLVPVAVGARVGGREGRATVWLPASHDLRPPTSTSTLTAAGGADGPREVEVELALPALSLREEELGRAAPGDIVLLGASDPAALFTGAYLVTTTGWRLAPVTFEEYRASFVRVRVGGLDPEPDRIPAWCDARLAVRPLVGRRRLSLDLVRGWREGESLELEKELDGALALSWRGRVFARAEEVEIDGELGARLLTCDRSGMGES